ncbi:CHASE3 domain-containing protein [Nocardia sp. NBC_01503]|uniref:sensor histidine kinase n=1 Tax=Nocardia sp. NBC_01503 TaxID=2975997 RepID=UPI002E7AC509|nr:CHASE3 domain-containing protein [Nocardia sp. NBC_01503]WTL30026.1 CHASE3 domain-containing protein [Nocardia sp. NBC_01503]
MTATHFGIGRVTAQAWFQRVLALMVFVVLVGVGLTALTIGATARVSDILGRQIQPAATEAYRLQSALANQETGVRGYAITADPQFLEPFTLGREDEPRAIAHLRALLADRPQLLADVEALEQAAGVWRNDYAQPLIATITPGTVRPVDGAASATGKVEFDALRDRFTTLNTDLSAAVENGRHDLEHKRAIRNVALFGMVIAFLVTTLVLTVLMRRLVARPLRELVAASLRVADGDFEHRITVGGPADLATVAEAVESMRRRIVAELESSRVQEALLAGQAADLDQQAVELRRSNTELEQFAYVASHDLREPLRKVASFCELLERRYGDQLDERARQYIAFAVDGANRMQILIEDLLTFSRVGRVHDAIAATDLDRTLDRALANLSAAVEDSGLQLERPERLPELTGEPTQLIMLWQNLISNAIKFHRPEVTPIVLIECEPEPGEPVGWRFSVSDNGIGIAPEFAEQVFVIFRRLHGRDDYSGTGIGLALCKKIVDFHGGRIWIDTTYTGGTRICFTLFERIRYSASASSSVL